MMHLMSVLFPQSPPEPRGARVVTWEIPEPPKPEPKPQPIPMTNAERIAKRRLATKAWAERNPRLEYNREYKAKRRRKGVPSLYRLFILHEAQHVAGISSFLQSNWKAFADAGKPLQVAITEYKSKRSDDQNKRYWAVLREIAEKAWINGKQYSDEVWHEQMKRQFIGMESLPSGGHYGISTTKLSVSEFAEYMTQVEQYAASELGVQFDA